MLSVSTDITSFSKKAWDEFSLLDSPPNFSVKQAKKPLLAAHQQAEDSAENENITYYKWVETLK